jgi:hypothetical protein
MKGIVGKEKWFDVGVNKQITLTSYDWRAAILDFRINFVKKQLKFMRVDILRFRFVYIWYGSIF